MKKNPMGGVMVRLIIVLGVLFSSQLAFAQKSATSIGIGYGPDYSGVGVNYGFNSGDIFKYVAAGCPRPGYGGHYSCGASVGFTESRPFGLSDHYGLGISVGLGYSDSDKYGTGSTVNFSASAGYFFNGVHSPGWHIGLTPGIQFVGTEFNIVSIIGFGYQM